MKRRILASLLVLVMALTALAPAASAVEGEGGSDPTEGAGNVTQIEVDTAGAYADAVARINASTGGEYVVSLTEDIDIGDLEAVSGALRMTVGENVTVTLLGNGHKISSSGAESFNFTFRILGGTLNLGMEGDAEASKLEMDFTNASDRTEPIATIGDGQGIPTPGTLNMYDGVKIANVQQGATMAGCIQVVAGVFNMRGGEISSSFNSVFGRGAVCIFHTSDAERVFNMYGGKIIDNPAPTGGRGAVQGGGIYCALGTVNIYGGEISGNQATESSGYGGGIFVNSGTLNISGGTISGNAAKIGGGIFANNSTVTITGGTISGNRAVGDDAGTAGYGGGIYAQGSTVSISDKAILCNNTAGLSGADISFAGSSLTLRDAGGMNQIYAADGREKPIDGWYQDWSDDRYAPSLDGTAVDVSGTMTVPIDLVASYRIVPEPVVVKPADITIYMGGADGTGGAVNADGTIVGSTSLPEPGFTVDLPEELEDALEAGGEGLTDLIFRESDPASTKTKTWMFQSYDGQDDTTVYKLVPAEGQAPTRVQFVDTDDNVVTSDDFDPGQHVNQTLEMSLYKGDGADAVGDITVTYGDVTYKVESSSPAALTVRGTTDQAEYAAVNGTLTPGKPGLAAPEGAVFTINESDVTVPDASGVALLFDSIINHVGDDRTGLLEKRAETYFSEINFLPAAGNTFAYEFKYLDLVDRNNGNAWVKAVDSAGNGADVTVRWPLPAGTSGSTRFTLLHFEGLHREMDSSSIEQAVRVCSVKSISAENTGTHVEFQVTGGEFSPFALVWEEREPDDTPSRPDRPSHEDDDDSALNRKDHYAYIIGYPDGTVQPQGSITRAEVATIFFRLLTDEARADNWSQRNGFADISGSDWFNNAVSTLTHMGILDGYEDGTFQPNAPITRAEFTKLAVSFFDYADKTYQDSGFTDVEPGMWYTDFVNAAVELGLIEGYEDHTFRPQGNITRAEACTLVNRTLGRKPHEDHLLPRREMNTWSDNHPAAWYYEAIQEATNSHDYRTITDGGERAEHWTKKLEDRDWAALERAWSNAGDAPGGEVMD